MIFHYFIYMRKYIEDYQNNENYKLMNTYSKIEAEAVAIAGGDFSDHNTVGFDEYESISVQQTCGDGDCSVEGAGIVDVIDMANSMANRADRVAACQVPPPLVSE
jgi:hypothetical protein